jgi:glycolate oxidase iron-sulfur subunit
LLGGNRAVFRLLARIPGLRVSSMPDNERCCGAAGTYLLRQPEMAAALLDDKLVSIRDLKPDIIVTTNPGCALHLIAGIRESGLDVEVCHPAELIARQLCQTIREPRLDPT